MQCVLRVTLRGKKIAQARMGGGSGSKEGGKGGSAHLVMQIIHGLIRGDAAERGMERAIYSSVFPGPAGGGECWSRSRRWTMETGELAERVASWKKRNYL